MFRKKSKVTRKNDCFWYRVDNVLKPLYDGGEKRYELSFGDTGQRAGTFLQSDLIKYRLRK